jgi:hypothetical protein
MSGFSIIDPQGQSGGEARGQNEDVDAAGMPWAAQPGMRTLIPVDYDPFAEGTAPKMPSKRGAQLLQSGRVSTKAAGRRLARRA